MILNEQFEVSTKVSEKNIATAMGSGDVQVFATPMMIALMEEAASKCLAQHIEPSQTSVGAVVNVSHNAATPIGMTVRAVSEIIAIDGKKIDFKVTAYDEVGIIGEGTHTRFIVDREKFHARASAKLQG